MEIARDSIVYAKPTLRGGCAGARHSPKASRCHPQLRQQQRREDRPASFHETARVYLDHWSLPGRLTLARTVRLRNRDVEHATATRFPIQSFHRAIGFRIIGHADVSEILAVNEVNAEDLSVGLE